MNIENIDINKLFVSNINARKTLSLASDDTSIIDLTDNIRINGLLHPLIARMIVDDNEVMYEIIAGQRRYRACVNLGLTTIPCNIINVNDNEAEEISLIENVQRNPMSTYDKVKAYSKLCQNYDGDITKVAQKINISILTAARYIRLNALPDDILKLLDEDNKTYNIPKISMELADELLRLPKTTKKIVLLQRISKLRPPQKIKVIKKYASDPTILLSKIIADVVAVTNKSKKICPNCSSEQEI
jgi:ParB family transcriptional regulator, chromosome partitioning protein